MSILPCWNQSIAPRAESLCGMYAIYIFTKMLSYRQLMTVYLYLFFASFWCIICITPLTLTSFESIWNTIEALNNSAYSQNKRRLFSLGIDQSFPLCTQKSRMLRTHTYVLTILLSLTFHCYSFAEIYTMQHVYCWMCSFWVVDEKGLSTQLWKWGEISFHGRWSTLERHYRHISSGYIHNSCCIKKVGVRLVVANLLYRETVASRPPLHAN